MNVFDVKKIDIIFFPTSSVQLKIALTLLSYSSLVKISNGVLSMNLSTACGSEIELNLVQSHFFFVEID